LCEGFGEEEVSWVKSNCFKVGRNEKGKAKLWNTITYYYCIPFNHVAWIALYLPFSIHAITFERIKFRLRETLPN